MSEIIAPAKLPDYGLIIKQYGGLSEKDKVAAAAARAQYAPKLDCEKCEGDLDIGFFFDGTDNNKDRDWGPDDKNPNPFLKQKHTNIVRLLHAFPDEKDEMKNRFTLGTTNKCYRYYVPGVGTEFKDAGDNGNFASSMAGSAAGWGGEARIIWALFQFVNAIWRFYNGDPQITNDVIRGEIEKIQSNSEETFQQTRENNPIATPFGTVGAYIRRAARRLFTTEENNALRKKILKKYLAEAKKELMDDTSRKPKLRRITVNVFGFSRGAAEARAFVNYLLELRDTMQEVDIGQVGKSVKIAGVTMNIQFMGLFDTVASVGVAGLYSFSEGHYGWADNTQEIPHRRVGECVHLVAAHETRACFPLDSVRVEGKYAANVHEIVYPGAHSDLGGGYFVRSLGKDDWLYKGRPILNMDDPEYEKYRKMPEDFFHYDKQLARVACFDMYCRALMAGVPLYTLAQLEAQGEIGQKYAKDLRPPLETVNALIDYTIHSGIHGGSVEDQSWEHFGLYLGWRWSLGKKYFVSEKSLQQDIKHVEAKIKELKEELSQNRVKQKSVAGGSSNPFKALTVKDGQVVQNSELQALADREKVLVGAIKRGEDEILAYQKDLEGVRNGAIVPGEEIRRLREPESYDALGKTAPPEEAGFLEDTQRALLIVTGAYCREILKRVKILKNDMDPLSNKSHLEPLSNPMIPLERNELKMPEKELQASRARVLEATAKLRNL